MTSSEEYVAALPRKRMGAGVLFTDEAGRAMIAEPVYKDHWELIGGAVEQDESPRQGAAREVEEELGKALLPGRLLVVDWVPPRPGRTEAMMLVYDGGMLTERDTAGIRLPAGELRSWAWCDEEQIKERMSELLARRVIAALGAKAEGVVFELENGFRVS